MLHDRSQRCGFVLGAMQGIGHCPSGHLDTVALLSTCCGSAVLKPYLGLSVHIARPVISCLWLAKLLKVIMHAIINDASCSWIQAGSLGDLSMYAEAHERGGEL